MRYAREGARTYRQVRTLPAPTLAAWRAALTAAVPGRVTRIVDVGCGTGQFIGPLAEWFDATVVGVEPSPGMRAEAHEAGIGPVLGGVGEALPLRSASADLAWLSTVVHQFADLDAAVGEVGRVVGPEGRIAIRGYLADLGPIGWFGHFPGIERSIGRFPTTEQVIDAFGRAGRSVTTVTTVDEWWPFSSGSYTERARQIHHVDSMLAPLTEDELEAGLASVRAAHPDLDEVHQVHGALRLVVFGPPVSVG